MHERQLTAGLNADLQPIHSRACSQPAQRPWERPGEALLLAHMHPIAKKGRFWTDAWKIRIEIEQA